MFRFYVACLLLSLGPVDSPAIGQDTAIQRLDLDDWSQNQVIVDREPGQYLGHPTTCLLDDGKTILCVYPKGHGKGGIIYKRSRDGGRTWSERLETPDSWATSKEVPTLHRVTGPGGKKTNHYVLRSLPDSHGCLQRRGTELGRTRASG